MCQLKNVWWKRKKEKIQLFADSNDAKMLYYSSLREIYDHKKREATQVRNLQEELLTDKKAINKQCEQLLGPCQSNLQLLRRLQSDLPNSMTSQHIIHLAYNLRAGRNSMCTFCKQEQRHSIDTVRYIHKLSRHNSCLLLFTAYPLRRERSIRQTKLE